jgi:hypothetical protein
MKTKQKGDIALSKAISHFVDSGYEILLPLGDRRPYDLVVELEDGTLKKVQCKYTSSKSTYGRYVVSLRVAGGNQTRYKAVKYNKEDFDIIFVYTGAKEIYVIPFSEIKATSSFKLNEDWDKWKISSDETKD